MKKILLFIAALLLVAFAFCQPKPTLPKSYDPYVSAGVSLSSAVWSPGIELGIYNDKDWFAVGAYTYRNTPSSAYETYSQFKWYHKVASNGLIDVFGYSALDVKLDKTKNIIFEPGAVIVFNIRPKFAPQISLTTPIGENTTPFKPALLSAGISLNYWIK